MKSDPRIVDARRRARATAHATGTSYQKTLDEIARSTGRRDWEDFVANPCRLPGEDKHRPVPGTIEVVEERVDGHPKRTWHRRRPARLSITLAACIVLVALMFWSASYDEVRGATNAGLSWERTVAVSSRMRSLYADNDKAMYVLAKRLPDDRRDVRLIMLDNRPANNGIVTRAALRLGLLDRGTATFRNYGTMFHVFERHPVARLHSRADCRKGLMTYLETEVADSMTSTPVAVMPSWRPKARRLGTEDLQTVCSDDTMERTARIERGT